MISALKQEELGPSRRLAENLLYLSNDNELFTFKHFTVNSLAELKKLLVEIKYHVKNGMKPIMHFDMHGNEKSGLEISPTKEMISWTELTDYLREINVATKNNLCVIACACFGLNAIMPLSIHSATPFLVLLAPEKEVLVGYLEDKIFPFYRTLIDTGSIDEAYNLHISEKFIYFHSEKMLVLSIARYIKVKCKKHLNLVIKN